MKPYRVNELAQIINGNLSGKADAVFRFVSTDSRTAVIHPETVFFALSGSIQDGHYYIPSLIQKGIRIFVVNKPVTSDTCNQEITFIIVENTLKALQDFAAFHRQSFHYPVWAITGSNGKTVVKEWLYECLHDDFAIIRSPKSYNSQVGVPLSILLLEEGFDMAIFEAGISLPGEMEKLTAIIKPNIGIFTMIGDAHQENFCNLDQKIDEKIKLFENCSKIYVSLDQVKVFDRIKNTYPEKTIVSWSLKKETTDLYIHTLVKADKQTVAEGFFREKRINLVIPFVDDASVENVLLIVLILFDLGFDHKTIGQRIGKLQNLPMRLELKQGKNNCTLINDSYNSDIHSLSIALDLLNRQNQHSSSTLILSDILQSGMSENDLYQTVASLLQIKQVKRFIGIGEALIRNRHFFNDNSLFYKSVGEFLSNHPETLFSNEALLIKGARTFEFENIVRILEQKEHRTILEINLNALIHNLNVFRALLKPSTKVMAMVKAFSYGSGSHEVAGLLQFHRIDYLGVAFVDEGVSLRQAMINIPIMVMQPEEHAFHSMIENHLEPEIYSFEILESLSAYLKQHNIQDYPVHIKFDTGMHRMGFLPDEADRLINCLMKESAVKVTSVFSHLAASDEKTHDDFTRLQIEVFSDIREKFIQAFGHNILFHILNSEGISRFSNAQFDMVRLGIGLYGICHSLNEKLMHVGTLKSTVIQVKKVKKHGTIGYNRKWIAEEDMEIAIVPIGYADGLNRRLSNGRGYFVIHNKKVPIVGNICMDVSMADVTGLQVKAGDEVIVFGKYNSVQEIAEIIGTIPYEVLTGISGRVKRVYYQE